MEDEIVQQIGNLEIAEEKCVDGQKKTRRRHPRKSSEKGNVGQFCGKITPVLNEAKGIALRTRDSTSEGIKTSPEQLTRHITSTTLTVPVLNSHNSNSDRVIERRPLITQPDNEGFEEQKKMKSKSKKKKSAPKSNHHTINNTIICLSKQNKEDSRDESNGTSADTDNTGMTPRSKKKSKEQKVLDKTPETKRKVKSQKNLSYSNKSESPSMSPKKRRSKDNKDNVPSQPLKFEPYITPEEAQAGLSNGTLVKGVIRINPRFYTDAYVSQEDTSLQDYYIGSVVDRNRALEGDEVVLKIYPKEEWNDGQMKAKVVHILKKVHQRVAVGILTIIHDKGRKIPSFQPRDKRVPFMNVTLNSLPQDFFRNPKKYEDVLFMASIIDWQIPKFAIGVITNVVGMLNDIKSETRGILLENEVFFGEFPENIGRDALIGKETIPEKEFEYREDFRKECIFTIDPSTAKDLDDAVSCKRLQNGNFEIGVHIADVTYYLTEGTLLDQIVSKRATSVYLVDKVYHMLPIELTSTCSLLPGKDCLTFSVIFEMTPEGEVVNKRFTRSVINSCCQLAYEHAQKVIEAQDINSDELTAKTVNDNKDTSNRQVSQGSTINELNNKSKLELKYDTERFPQIGNNFTAEQIAEKILFLNTLAQKMRKKRFENGALRIDQIKLGFALNDSGEPTDFFMQGTKEANHMIEEFMLLANMAVAEKIYNAYPKMAFLRCHIPPVRRMVDEIKDVLECVGIFIQINSSKEIHDSLMKYRSGDFGYSRSVVLNHLFSKPMQRATYFCTHNSDPDTFHHYALCVPFYTHFTSPIRRYADVMVHRLLACALNYMPDPKWSPDRVHEIANICNRQKNNAKRAGEASCELYLAHYIERHQPFVSDAVVVAVFEKAFDVVVLTTGSVVRLYTNNLEEGIQVQTEQNLLNGKTLWKIWFLFPAESADNSVPVVQAIDLFQVIRVALKRKPKTNKLDAQLLRPRLLV